MKRFKVEVSLIMDNELIQSGEIVKLTEEEIEDYQDYIEGNYLTELEPEKIDVNKDLDIEELEELDKSLRDRIESELLEEKARRKNQLSQLRDKARVEGTNYRYESTYTPESEKVDLDDTELPFKEIDGHTLYCSNIGHRIKGEMVSTGELILLTDDKEIEKSRLDKVNLDNPEIKFRVRYTRQELKKVEEKIKELTGYINRARQLNDKKKSRHSQRVISDVYHPPEFLRE